MSKPCSASARPLRRKGGVEYLPLRWRRLGLGNDHNDLGICSTFLKETADGNEIENLADIPTLDELPPKLDRLLVVKEVVLLEHGEHPAGSQHLHGFVEEEIGNLLVGQRAVFLLISLVGPLRAVGVKLRGKRWISDDYADLFLDRLLLTSFEEAAGVDSIFLQGREELHAGPNLHRLQCIAECETKAERSKFDSAFLQINAAQPLS